jgi:putative transposase
MLHRHPNTPAHLFIDDAPYFITGAIYQKRKLLQNAALKQSLLDKIRANARHFGWMLEHWVILDNHYHLMLRSRRGEDLPELIRRLHGGTSHDIAEATQCTKPVWWNYWDYCPRNEADYYTRLNYLLYNPVKHGYISDLREYPYSSFPALLENLGREPLARQFSTYPEFRDLDVDDDF